MTFPVLPVHTISKRRVVLLKIAAVQVGAVTGIVPPGSAVILGTISVIVVVVFIFGGEGKAMMIRKGIASSSWKKTRDRREASDLKVSQHVIN